MENKAQRSAQEINDLREIRRLSIAGNKMMNDEIRQSNNALKGMLKIMASSNLERQSLYVERKKAAGFKRISAWVKSDPKYEHAIADIHANNAGICNKDAKLLVILNVCLQYLESKEVPPDLVEDIAALFKVFGYRRVSNPNG
jgi:hypothetical protein